MGRNEYNGIKWNEKMLQNYINILKSNPGNSYISKDFPFSFRTRSKDLKKLRSLIDKQNPMVKGIIYGNGVRKNIDHWYMYIKEDKEEGENNV